MKLFSIATLIFILVRGIISALVVPAFDLVHAMLLTMHVLPCRCGVAWQLANMTRRAAAHLGSAWLGAKGVVLIWDVSSCFNLMPDIRMAGTNQRHVLLYEATGPEHVQKTRKKKSNALAGLLQQAFGIA